MISQNVEIGKDARIAKNVIIWSYTQIREAVSIGESCIIGRNVYIDHHVKIGNKVKIQNNVLIYYDCQIEDGVFIGPAACLINDKYPRAVNLQGKLKKKNDWKAGKILVKKGASIGAGAIVLPNIVVGSYALVGAGSVVTKSIPPFAKVAGNPAKIIGYVCKAGHDLDFIDNARKIFCAKCKKYYILKNG